MFTEDVKLYHVAKYSLNLSFKVHYIRVYAKISSAILGYSIRISLHRLTLICWILKLRNLIVKLHGSDVCCVPLFCVSIRKQRPTRMRVEFSTLRKVYSSWHRHLLLPFQKWKNPFLAWKPEDYNGIKSINVDPKLVWKPDLVLYNK